MKPFETIQEIRNKIKDALYLSKFVEQNSKYRIKAKQLQKKVREQKTLKSFKSIETRRVCYNLIFNYFYQRYKKLQCASMIVDLKQNDQQSFWLTSKQLWFNIQFQDEDLLEIPPFLKKDKYGNVYQVPKQEILKTFLPKHKRILKVLFNQTKNIKINSLKQFDLALKCGKELFNSNVYLTYLKCQKFNREQEEKDKKLKVKSARHLQNDKFKKYIQNFRKLMLPFIDYTNTKFTCSWQQKQSKSFDSKLLQYDTKILSKFKKFLHKYNQQKAYKKSRKNKYWKKIQQIIMADNYHISKHYLKKFSQVKIEKITKKSQSYYRKNRRFRGSYSLTNKRQKKTYYQKLILNKFKIPKSLEKFIQNEKKRKQILELEKQKLQKLKKTHQNCQGLNSDEQYQSQQWFIQEKRVLEQDFNGSLYNKTMDFRKKPGKLFDKRKDIKLFLSQMKLKMKSLQQVPGVQEEKTEVIKPARKKRLIKFIYMCMNQAQNFNIQNLTEADQSVIVPLLIEITKDFSHQRRKSCTNEMFGGNCKKYNTTFDIFSYKGNSVKVHPLAMFRQLQVTKRVLKRVFAVNTCEDEEIQENIKKVKRCKRKKCTLNKMRKKYSDNSRHNSKLKRNTYQGRLSKLKSKRFLTLKNEVITNKPNVQDQSWFYQSLGPLQLPSRKEFRRAKTNELLNIESSPLKTVQVDIIKNKKVYYSYTKHSCQNTRLRGLEPPQRITKRKNHNAIIRKYKLQQEKRKPTKYIYKKFTSSDTIDQMLNQKARYLNTTQAISVYEKILRNTHNRSASTSNNWFQPIVRGYGVRDQPDFMNKQNLTMKQKIGINQEVNVDVDPETFIKSFYVPNQNEKTQLDYHLPRPKWQSRKYVLPKQKKSVKIFGQKPVSSSLESSRYYLSLQKLQEPKMTITKTHEPDSRIIGQHKQSRMVGYQKVSSRRSRRMSQQKEQQVLSTLISQRIGAYTAVQFKEPHEMKCDDHNELHIEAYTSLKKLTNPLFTKIYQSPFTSGQKYRSEKKKIKMLHHQQHVKRFDQLKQSQYQHLSPRILKCNEWCAL